MGNRGTGEPRNQGIGEPGNRGTEESGNQGTKEMGNLGTEGYVPIYKNQASDGSCTSDESL